MTGFPELQQEITDLETYLQEQYQASARLTLEIEESESELAYLQNQLEDLVVPTAPPSLVRSIAALHFDN